jgi:hypothetical protein
MESTKIDEPSDTEDKNNEPEEEDPEPEALDALQSYESLGCSPVIPIARYKIKKI